MDSNGQETPENSRIPDNTAFKQQRLPAWQPILTAKSILPGFFIIAAIFIPVGAVLLMASRGIIEAEVDYTECKNAAGLNCADLRLNSSNYAATCECNLTINVEKEMTGDIFIYYGLTSFYQNHRRYVSSRDDNQLLGTHVTASSISTSCGAFTLDGGKPIAPCGAIANSLFNDSFSFVTTQLNANIIRTGLAWYTDHNVKFKNPSPTDNLTEAFKDYTKPKYWQKRVEELDPSNNDNNGYKNEALEIWMRTAAFPSFRKPYGKLNITTLKAGRYTIQIDYNYPVTSFSGTKKFIISTTSWMGGKNDFLGIAYIVVGSLSFAVCIALFVVHRVTHKKSAPSSPSSIS